MRILVTGASRGIGKETALKFLLNNHEVIGLDILDSHEDLKSFKNYKHIKKDVRDQIDVIPNLDILIFSHGTIIEEEAIEVNLTSTIKLVNSYLKNSNNIKSIIFVGSASASNGGEFPNYVASKGGLISYMKYLANELGKKGIIVNSVSPGGVNTEVNKHILENKDLYDKVLNETILKKRADPQEIAEFIYFIGINNKSMTGQDIIIDNGELLKSNFIW